VTSPTWSRKDSIQGYDNRIYVVEYMRLPGSKYWKIKSLHHTLPDALSAKTQCEVAMLDERHQATYRVMDYIPDKGV